MRRLIFLLTMILVIAGCGNQGEQAGEETENTNEDVASETNTAEESSEKASEDESGIEPETEEEQPSTIPTEQVEILKDEREGIVPERIEIPAIDVDAPVQHLGLKDNGEMEVPDTLNDTSWYEPGYEVGAPGNAVIAGHVDDTVNPGVFKQLHTLEPGDEIIVHGEDGDTLTFTVYDKELFDADEAPVDKIFGYSHNSLLNLITCEGPYDYDVGGTPNRWVIYTELDTES
ncbi:class F sortase [Salinicoccus carnicancri]|uniref:class F sortase n=1 Tax=Salinicoccus carnicancri TaxID=558170 RepID=UPI0002F4168C|nr:class F sortase [Salinicoccus carnicancri]